MSELIDAVISSYKSLRVPVMLPHDEVDRLIVERLVQIRNAKGNKNEDMSYIDKTIRFFLTEDEFARIIKGEQGERTT